ncbi:MAG: hypothetical protein ACD_19C00016G0038 [uncultured bacterium]|nr:MAG: hypothetical protein ACD_19C00016G0038 [uncultured bacterium]
MPIRNTKKINLIPQDEFEKSSLGRILKWALSTFRIMVIITELVVMSAFLSRFWLDAKNSDLNENINNNKSQIIAYKNVEEEFRSIQKRISIVKSIYLEPKISSTVSYVSNLVPQDTILTSFSDIDRQITIKASSFSEKSVAQFLVNLEEGKSLTDIKLSQVSSNIDNNELTLFTISAKTK